MGDTALTQRTSRFAVTLGLHGSASTWVYSVVREVAATACGETKVLGLYADSARQLFEDPRVLGRFLIWKTHVVDADFDMLIHLANPPLFLSIRDPRDCAVSLMRRFNASFEAVAEALPSECTNIMRYVDAGHPLFRYENRFFEDRRTVYAVSERLGISLPQSILDNIFDRYRTDAMREFANRLKYLPAERLARGPNGFVDVVTQIHQGHIDDGRTGKWREYLQPEQQEFLTGSCKRFLERFDYT